MEPGKKEIDEQVFSEIYVNYYSRMLRFAYAYLMNKEDAENIVQDIFAYLWGNRSLLKEVRHLQAFLFMLVKRRCIDFLRLKINNSASSLSEIENEELEYKLYSLETLDEEGVTEEEMQRMLHKAIEHLPEKCRYIFIQAKINHKKYREIAAETGLSIQTIKNQMTIAIGKLQTELRRFLPFLMFVLG
ncbi:RNA polymerase sigma-70 factor [Bacteroides heparinolyticus]|uniref:RNA polymerase sigma-70 factor n=1 Tax=Prevotella heparinolytica TaxID=28113 RepID=A0A3P1ZXN5_9BACE|nr:RNA polymerase sigma-70 factor [Bacteroides heparinolyticus]RRD87882.1 RNA polymerase sigma-70 factor [Bacteroides heparinolyticus]